MKLGFLINGFAVGLLLNLGSFTLPNIPTAEALCAAPQAPNLLGNWRNVDANTRGIRRINIKYLCEDVRRCDAETGQCSPVRVGYYIQPFGACSPRDCDWGDNPATFASGSLTANINQSFARRNLRARIISSGSRRGQLMLTWRTEFTDGSGRSNYTRVEYFVK